jgi:dedicator of cytokinesis protein 3
MEEPQVFIGIFPASHIHVRDELADAEGRLQEVFNRINEGLDPYFFPSNGQIGNSSIDGRMATLREEDETVPELPESFMRKSIKLGPRPEQGHALRAPVPVTQPVRPSSTMRARDHSPSTPTQKPPPPRPSLKSGDDTAAGGAQPLIDEISSALREWHNLLFTYLSRRDYKLFEIVRDHIEELHLGRRQLLAQTLSAEETVNLRRDCVQRLVKGNVVQGLDVIVRHPAWGGLVTVDVEGEFDPRSWVGGVRMYAMQVGLAYVDVGRSEVVTAGRGGVFGDVTGTVGPYIGNNATPLTGAFGSDFGSQFPGSPIIAPRSLPSLNPLSPILTESDQLLTSSSSSTGVTASAKFFHIHLSLEALVASLCSPGETAELYFSLYNRSEAKFLTEEFCVILNHHGALARPQSGNSGNSSSATTSLSINNANSAPGGLGKIRTLFTDLGTHDIQESIYLVCRIVRNGAMKLAGASSTSGYPSGAMRRGSETLLTTLSESESTSFSPGPGPNGHGGGLGQQYRSDFEAALNSHHQTYRRPFGCAVLELTQLAKWSVDRTEAGLTKEHTLPIFVPTREAAFSTLHQAIIGSDTAEFEKSPRAEMIAVTVKLFYGDAPTIIRENPSLLQDVPLTSRLGFPDVVFPGASWKLMISFLVFLLGFSRRHAKRGVYQALGWGIL